jgi:uncharacterized protein YciI
VWFLIHNISAPDWAEKRPLYLEAHHDYLRAAQDRMITAGPYFSADGKHRMGSVFIVDLPDLAAAEAWIADEPFTRHGVYASHTIHIYDHRWPQHAGGSGNTD